MSGDVLVIGAGPSGLTAATYMARAGARVIVLEAEHEPGGNCASRLEIGAYAVPRGPDTLAALDPRVIQELKLSRLGLRFAVRDLPLINLRAEGKALRLGRDLHEARRAIAPLSQRDAERYPPFRSELCDFARKMRAVWWEDGSLADADARAGLRRLTLTSTSTLLESVFESEPVKAAFAFDALTGGLSPCAAGSSLVLAWLAAQEMCGLQGAWAVPHGGPATVCDALLKAAANAGVDIRTEAKVTQLLVEDEAVTGAVDARGDVLMARTVLSSLSRRTTLLDFLPPGAAGFAAAQELSEPQQVGEGKVVLALNALPLTFKPPARYVVAERLENSVAAQAEARAGRVPAELTLEVIRLETGAEPPFLLSIMVRPLPVKPLEPPKAFMTRLMQSVLKGLEHHAPDIRSNIAAFALQPPAPRDPFTVRQMTSGWRERIETPIRGLYLCGRAAEPVPIVSCRAARIAAALAAGQMKRGRS